ncbi:MAG TPA: SymE family type I addiction module toxin [Paraburkholderia sp.]|uniref:SymE family type I addiction module toxin n=1 Tax=Paraburkholderia sp. TaxID=1926495 RepID=UPI002B46198F|nr:SymE family type I addiction module toxin [Paraburkholderia sp.]HKR38984.1 SymE family type I addiction module toxin [Paraburkholderia sp.]
MRRSSPGGASLSSSCGDTSARTRTEPPLYPWLKLSGRWLELADFEAGQQMRGEMHHGRLVITHD